MALDKLVDSTQLDTDLTAVANAIRTKGGTSAQLAFPSEFVSAIEAISTGGGGLPIYTGKHTVSNKNTQHAIKHNLNLNSYICLYWFDDMTTYVSGTTGTDTAIMFGVGTYKADLGLASENSGHSGYGMIKAYKQSTSGWAFLGNYNDTTSKDQMEMNYTYGVIVGTYSYVIIDLSNLSREVET